MEWMEQALLALAMGLPLVLAWMVVATAHRAVGLRLRASRMVIVARDAMPARERELLQPVAPLLAQLGFGYRVSTASDRAVAAPGQGPLYTDVYEHADGHTQAWVSPSIAPEQGEPCAVSFVSLLGDGTVQCTVNCYRHNLIAPPTYWTIHDDYLPDLRQAWERHLARTRPLDMRIVRDPLQVFRASQRATEMLLPDFEKRGIAVRAGDHWRLRWGHALRFAWGLLRGLRRVAKARKGLPKTARPAAGHAGAEIQAFEQQLAVLRGLRGGRRDQLKWFLVSAALFLAVGSLWISWSFLPILLAVIALHEGGHYLAMKLSGYRNLAVFFVPGLGGLASGEKADAGPWEKLLVYLAGPMPGLLLAVAGLAAQASGAWQLPHWFQEFLFASLIINYLNLLPITPLDGGRVVETFLFARLPFARFLFALAGVAAFVALGLALDDKVLLAVSALVLLALPHQWRVMRLDRAVPRHGGEVLDERGAIERIFMALQQPRFARWPFNTRAAAATALLPELQGRRPRMAEAAAGLLLYGACLVAPPVLAVLAFPQLRTLAADAAGVLQLVGDDAPPAAAPGPRGAPRDWSSEAARADTLPEAQRVEVLLAAAREALEDDEPEKARPWLQSAWELVAARPAPDLERARVLLARARLPDSEAMARELYRQVLAELEGQRDRSALLLLAEAKEQLTWLDDGGGVERTALLREVVEHREQAGAADDALLLAARTALARELDEQGAVGDAEALLRRNVDAVPLAADERRPEALWQRTRRLEQQVELAWFLLAHQRAGEAEALLAQVLAAAPARAGVSWYHAERGAREARLWAALQQPDAVKIEQAWREYDTSRGALARTAGAHLLHEVDRFVVALATRNMSTLEFARSGVFSGAASPSGKALRSFLCEPGPGRAWRAAQAKARQRAASESGVCDLPK